MERERAHGGHLLTVCPRMSYFTSLSLGLQVDERGSSPLRRVVIKTTQIPGLGTELMKH